MTMHNEKTQKSRDSQSCFCCAAGAGWRPALARWLLYHTSHFLAGFIGLPAGHLNASANSLRMES